MDLNTLTSSEIIENNVVKLLEEAMNIFDEHNVVIDKLAKVELMPDDPSKYNIPSKIDNVLLIRVDRVLYSEPRLEQQLKTYTLSINLLSKSLRKSKNAYKVLASLHEPLKRIGLWCTGEQFLFYDDEKAIWVYESTFATIVPSYWGLDVEFEEL